MTTTFSGHPCFQTAFRFNDRVGDSLSVSPVKAAILFGITVLLLLLPAGMDAEAQEATKAVDDDLIRETVTVLADTVERKYFDEDVAADIGVSLRERLAEGRYGNATSIPSLAQMLTRDMYMIAKDKHLEITRRRETTSGEPATEAAAEARRLRAERENFGITRVEVLSGNIGYLNLTHFYRPDEAREALTAAMTLLRHADAVILDMRRNTGGSPETVAMLASYFFEDPETVLFEITGREGTGRVFSVQPGGLAGRSESRPLYVLTSRRTFSGGEGLAFLLKERKRATLIGETTAGAANAGKPFPINAVYEATIPTGRVTGAVTGENWEGTGVEPDVSITASDALKTAYMRAIRGSLVQSADAAWKAQLEQILKGAESSKE